MRLLLASEREGEAVEYIAEDMSIRVVSLPLARCLVLLHGQPLHVSALFAPREFGAQDF